MEIAARLLLQIGDKKIRKPLKKYVTFNTYRTAALPDTDVLSGHDDKAINLSTAVIVIGCVYRTH